MKFYTNGTPTEHEHLGDYVRSLRQSRGYTQRQLAGVSGVGLRFLSDLENGKPTVSLHHAQLVLTMLGVDLLVHDRSLPWPPPRAQAAAHE